MTPKEAVKRVLDHIKQYGCSPERAVGAIGKRLLKDLAPSTIIELASEGLRVRVNAAMHNARRDHTETIQRVVVSGGSSAFAAQEERVAVSVFEKLYVVGHRTVLVRDLTVDDCAAIEGDMSSQAAAFATEARKFKRLQDELSSAGVSTVGQLDEALVVSILR